jgi:predicted membrane channel-forming protein YqfA (hemolysin III family)
MPDQIRHFQLFAYSAILLSLASSVVDPFLYPELAALRSPVLFIVTACVALPQVGWVWLIVNRKINWVRWSWIIIMTLGTFASFYDVRTSKQPIFWPPLILSYIAYLASANVLLRPSIAAWYRQSAEKPGLAITDV